MTMNILATNIKAPLAMPNTSCADRSPSISLRLERASGPDFRVFGRLILSRFILPPIASNILSSGAVTLPIDWSGSISEKLVFGNFELI